jgi:phosphoribosyl 1,2-cyclic phosphodiesterase
MKVKFWGVRGSIPTPVNSDEISTKIVNAIWKARNLSLNRSPEAEFDAEQKAVITAFVENLPITEKGTIGGNTPCVQIVTPEGKIVIVDCGSGIRLLGNQLMKREFAKGKGSAHILLSHTHWDHICGIPFFIPLYIPGNEFHFYSAHENLEERLAAQQHPWHFPVPWDVFKPKTDFHLLKLKGENRIGNLRVTLHELNHPGKSYAFRFETENSGAIVYASDAEYKQSKNSSFTEFIEFFRNANILIFDTQYTLTEALAKEDWGHSSAMIGIEMAMEAGVKNLVMFHHEPTYNDDKVVAMRHKTDQYQKILNKNRAQCNIHIAYEGLEMEA